MCCENKYPILIIILLFIIIFISVKFYFLNRNLELQINVTNTAYQELPTQKINNNYNERAAYCSLWYELQTLYGLPKRKKSMQRVLR